MNKYILVLLLLIIVVLAGGYYYNQMNTKPSTKVKFSSTADSANAVKIFPGSLATEALNSLGNYRMTTKTLSNGSTQVTLTPNNQPAMMQQYTVKKGESLYFIEKFSADDASNSDINSQDDHADVVDAQGYLVS